MWSDYKKKIKMWGYMISLVDPFIQQISIRASGVITNPLSISSRMALALNSLTMFLLIIEIGIIYI